MIMEKKYALLKIIKLLLFTVLGTLTCLACQESQTRNENLSLKGTQWKLAGIVDTQTGDLTVLEPTDCEECYTLRFDTDFTAIVRSINTNTLILNLLELDPNKNLTDDLQLELYDKDGKYYSEGDTFRRAILTTASYSATSEELKLYYSPTKRKYLLFKPF
jgi:hypothetical protein